MPISISNERALILDSGKENIFWSDDGERVKTIKNIQFNLTIMTVIKRNETLSASQVQIAEFSE